VADDRVVATVADERGVVRGKGPDPHLVAAKPVEGMGHLSVIDGPDAQAAVSRRGAEEPARRRRERDDRGAVRRQERRVRAVARRRRELEDVVLDNEPANSAVVGASVDRRARDNKGSAAGPLVRLPHLDARPVGERVRVGGPRVAADDDSAAALV